MTVRRQYVLNILWSWIGAATLILNGAIVAPYLIRRLGAEEFGIWAFGLSFVEYFWMIDLGVRPATVRLTAEYHALEKWTELNSILSTAAAYSSAIGCVILLLISFNTGVITRFFHITHPAFTLLLHVVSLSWAFGLVFNVFGAGIEGFQRFDITNRIFIGFGFVRSLSLLTAVHFGYGLRGMSFCLLASQFLMYAAFFLSLRSIFPRLKISIHLATKAAGLEIWKYARQLISAMLSARILTASIPSLITYFLGVRNVTYYSNTVRTLDYAGEGIGRFGTVMSPRAAHWMAQGHRDAVAKMGAYSNKYCLVLWLIFATFFSIYAYPLFQVWVNTDFADHSAFLLKLLLMGYTLWLGQFASASILMGIGRYSEYSASLLIESLVTVCAFGLTLPHFGLAGGIATYSAMIVLNRSLNLARIYCKEFDLKLLPFLSGIYTIPLALGALDVAGLWAVKHLWIPGTSWPQLIEVGAGNAIVLSGACFWLVLEPPHRAFVIEKIEELIKRFAPGEKPVLKGPA